MTHTSTSDSFYRTFSPTISDSTIDYLPTLHRRIQFSKVFCKFFNVHLCSNPHTSALITNDDNSDCLASILSKSTQVNSAVTKPSISILITTLLMLPYASPVSASSMYKLTAKMGPGVLA